MAIRGARERESRKRVRDEEKSETAIECDKREEDEVRVSVQNHMKQMLTIPQENTILINEFMAKLFFSSFQFSVIVIRWIAVNTEKNTVSAVWVYAPW